MDNYTDITDKMLEIANNNPNIRFVRFDTENNSINRSDFQTPAFVISPAQSVMNANSFVQYGFQLLYFDKMRQELDNYDDLLQESIQFILGFCGVLDLDYKVVQGVSLDPFLYTHDGAEMTGHQINILVESQYNFNKFKSPFYGN